MTISHVIYLEFARLIVSWQWVTEVLLSSFAILWNMGSSRYDALHCCLALSLIAKLIVSGGFTAPLYSVIICKVCSSSNSPSSLWTSLVFWSTTLSASARSLFLDWMLIKISFGLLKQSSMDQAAKVNAAIFSASVTSWRSSNVFFAQMDGSSAFKGETCTGGALGRQDNGSTFECTCPLGE